MRKSQAPSQLRLRLENSSFNPENVNNSKSSIGLKNNSENEENSQTIQRLPLFGFLEIPNNLRKQYVVPAGCQITKRSIELRATATLGSGWKKTPFLIPGGLSSFVPVSGLVPQTADDDNDSGEELPKNFVPPHEPLILWKDPNYVEDSQNEGLDESPRAKQHRVEVIPELCCKLRPHQREGVAFLFECTMRQRGFDGEGCILADDMGLGKTLMSITLMWTLLNQGIDPSQPNKAACRRAMVACPTSLVGNWDNELKKWIPNQQCVTFPVKGEAKSVIRNFLNYKGAHAVLIISYDQQRLNKKMFEVKPSMGGNAPIVDLLICDEAHKLKNADSAIAMSLSALPARKRILLSGTPMQNELGEFFNMVNFCNPGVLGSINEFRKRYERPILESREPDCPQHKKDKAAALQRELSTIVNEFILKRGNVLNAQHLPPKLVQFVCCKLSDEQKRMYDGLIGTKDVRHILQGKQLDSLLYIRHLINVCSHPQLIEDTYRAKVRAGETDEVLEGVCKLADAPSTVSAPARGRYALSGSVSTSTSTVVDPHRSGKLLVLYRMMHTMRTLKNGERIVVVSNYTSTLDLVESMCSQNNWPVLRLDGSTAGTKRTKLVEQFNDPASGCFAFLLSSKAGGCGINLIGGSRLVLFDPDWNPASDKQAAGRIWREGQKRRCFIYRFMSSGTIEEKIIQRQLSKEGLQNIVEDTEQVNTISSTELKALFVRRDETPSDTHDTLACKRCSTVQVKDGALRSGNAVSLSDTQIKACLGFVDNMHEWLQQQARICGSEFPPYDMMALRAGLCTDSSTGGATMPSKQSAFSNLPQFSRAIQRTMHNIQLEQDTLPFLEIGTSTLQPKGKEVPDVEDIESAEAPNSTAHVTSTAQSARFLPRGVNAEEEFTNRWIQFVPELQRLGREARIAEAQRCKSATVGQASAPAEEEEEDVGYVEQEGCPEESDFNKWSHHVSVDTCDDDVLKRAMVGTDTISFVFGLEVNWDLLQQKCLEEAEAKEARQEKLKQDLAELNARRKSKLLGAAECTKPSVDKPSFEDVRRPETGRRPKARPEVLEEGSENEERLTENEVQMAQSVRPNPSTNESCSPRSCGSDELVSDGRSAIQPERARKRSPVGGDSLHQLSTIASSSIRKSNAIANYPAHIKASNARDREPHTIDECTNIASDAEMKDVDGLSLDRCSGNGKLIKRSRSPREVPNVGAFGGRGGTFVKDTDVTVTRRTIKKGKGIDAEKSKNSFEEGLSDTPIVIDFPEKENHSPASGASQEALTSIANLNGNTDLQGAWNCADCTYQNDECLYEFMCGICGAKRPKAKRT